jgi:ribosome maturation factor RimP
MATENDILQAQIAPLLEELLAPTPAYFLVDVVVRGRYGATRKVDVLIDGDKGIGIDEVVALSRALGEKLDELDIVKGAFNLEVGSPGVDHPLSSPRQYAKNVGRSLLVELLVPSAEEPSILGNLIAADAETFTLAPAAKKPGRKAPDVPPLIFRYEEVKQAVVQVKF